MYGFSKSQWCRYWIIADIPGNTVNYFQTYYYWRISGGDDVSKPFLFRIVKANGTQEEQALRGFQSEQFWIASAGGPDPTGSLSSTHLVSATNPPTGKPKDKGTAKSSDSGGLSGGAQIGIGVGCGIGVGLALVAGVGYFFWRRRQKKSRDTGAGAGAGGSSQQQNQQQYYPGPGAAGQAQYHNASPPPMSQYRDDYSEAYQPWPSPGGGGMSQHSQLLYAAKTQQSASEMGGNEMRSPVEAPGGRWQEPQELQAGNVASKPGSPAPRTPGGIQPWDGRDAT